MQIFILKKAYSVRFSEKRCLLTVQTQKREKQIIKPISMYVYYYYYYFIKPNNYRFCLIKEVMFFLDVKISLFLVYNFIHI